MSSQSLRVRSLVPMSMEGLEQLIVESVLLGPRPPKRLSLAMITLQVCSLAYTTLSLHRCIVGAWFPCCFTGGL